mgnify:CR=1 FL=1
MPYMRSIIDHKVNAIRKVVLTNSLKLGLVSLVALKIVNILVTGKIDLSQIQI